MKMNHVYKVNMKRDIFIRDMVSPHIPIIYFVSTLLNTEVLKYMAEAIISIVLLANTLITTFGTFDTSMQTLIIILGLVSCIVIISLGIFMVVKAISKLKNNKTV